MIQEDIMYLARDDDVLFDFNYRYKIKAPIFSQQMKKGKPITIFENIDEFSEKLICNKEILIKLISTCLSCQNGVIKENNSVFFKGHYENEIINEIICNFIKKYMLCEECDKPEIKLTSNRGITYTCDACGHKGNIEYDQKIYDFVEKKIKQKAS
jgi:translation initiation factor 5